MSDRREVNVNRPEHSWIPFYRELARELVEDEWRSKQPEMVGMLQRLRAAGLSIHGIVDNLTDHIDPFTFYALFSRELRFENLLPVFEALRTEFKLAAEVQKEMPFIPYADHRGVGYFYGFEDIEDDIETNWDVFEGVFRVNNIEEVSARSSIGELIRRGLDVRGVGVSKLTSALYWINPFCFLHSDTVNAVGGSDLGIEAKDAESYIDCLIRTSELTEPSFPETNIEVFKSQNPDWEPPRVWIVRGGASGQSVDYQLENGVAGIGFNLGDIDLPGTLDGEAIREAYASRNPDASEGRVRANAGSVANFVRDIRICDYVLMPGVDRIHYGKVVSDPYHVPNGPWENRRDIEWTEGDRVLSRSDLPSLPPRTRTVTQATDKLKAEFFAWIESSDLPDDEKDEDRIDGESEDARAYGIDDMLKDGLFFERDELERILDRFEDKNNLILQGPPGVGKTFVSKRLAYGVMGESGKEPDGRIRNVQFHQSYSYEEFVQGYRPRVNDDDQLIFKLQDGTFLELCDKARNNPHDRYVMVIDEINRGNLSRVFGELLSMIEKDKRGDGFKIRLAGGNEFFVPENIYILGTMNLADRSLAGMDYAMRRRFAFVTLEPQYETSEFRNFLHNSDVPDDVIDRINDQMSELNRDIANDTSLGRNFAVGHSYFCDIPSEANGWEDADWNRWYRNIVETEIQPLLEEYWFDDLGKADAEVKKLLDGLS